MSEQKSTIPYKSQHSKTASCFKGDLAAKYATDYLKALELRQKGVKNYLPSGFHTLDKMMPGWLHEGHLIIVAGRPGMGKSAFAQQIAEAVAEQQRTVVLFTLEMSGYEIAERAISRRSGVPIPKLKTDSKLTAEDLRGVVDAFSYFSKLTFLIRDDSDIASIIKNSHSIAANLAELELPTLGCIVVDYLQLVGANAANRNLEVGQVTRSLKHLARELNVPIIALSQLNRAIENRNDKRPTMSDLRESGSIEQDADLVLFICREDSANADRQNNEVVEVVAAKNRHGSTGAAKLTFRGERIMFGDNGHE